MRGGGGGRERAGVLEWQQCKPGAIYCWIADAFAHHKVRYLAAAFRSLKCSVQKMRPWWNMVSEIIALTMPIPCPRNMPRKPYVWLSSRISLHAASNPTGLRWMADVCMMTSSRERGLVMTT